MTGTSGHAGALSPNTLGSHERRRAQAVFAAVGALMIAAAAGAQDEASPPVPDEPTLGRAVTGDELREYFTDQTRRGCYTDGRPAWEEHTAGDGVFYDILDMAGARAGEWWIASDVICYWYDRDRRQGLGPDCFTGRYADDGHFEFFGLGTGVLVATTRCDDPVMM